LTRFCAFSYSFFHPRSTACSQPFLFCLGHRTSPLPLPHYSPCVAYIYMTPLAWPWPGRRSIDEQPTFPLLFPFACHRPVSLLTIFPLSAFALPSGLRTCFGHKTSPWTHNRVDHPPVLQWCAFAASANKAKGYLRVFGRRLGQLAMATGNLPSI